MKLRNTYGGGPPGPRAAEGKYGAGGSEAQGGQPYVEMKIEAAKCRKIPELDKGGLYKLGEQLSSAREQWKVLTKENGLPTHQNMDLPRKNNTSFKFAEATKEFPQRNNLVRMHSLKRSPNPNPNRKCCRCSTMWRHWGAAATREGEGVVASVAPTVQVTITRSGTRFSSGHPQMGNWPGKVTIPQRVR